MEEGGGDVKLVPIVPTADPQPPSCPPHHYISSIFIHPPPPSPSHSTTILYKTHCHQTPDTQPYFIECVLEPDKHRAKGGVLGLAGCALLIGVLIEGITNTYWVQIPSATLPTICPEPQPSELLAKKRVGDHFWLMVDVMLYVCVQYTSIWCLN